MRLISYMWPISYMGPLQDGERGYLMHGHQHRVKQNRGEDYVPNKRKYFELQGEKSKEMELSNLTLYQFS